MGLYNFIYWFVFYDLLAALIYKLTVDILVYKVKKDTLAIGCGSAGIMLENSLKLSWFEAMVPVVNVVGAYNTGCLLFTKKYKPFLKMIVDAYVAEANKHLTPKEWSKKG